jgi:hypothetical protein
MMTRRKNFRIIKKLKIIKRVKNGKLKDRLFCECGILEGTVCCWLKEENKLHSFVDSIEDNIGLQRKETRLCEQSEVDECLYRWLLQKCSERVPIDGVIVEVKQFNLTNYSLGMRRLKFLMGGFKVGKFNMGYASLA